MMVSFNRSELKKLAAMCDDRQYILENIRDSEDGKATHLERCLAHREAEWMKQLSAKLLEVAESNAKRIEITY